MKLPSAHSRSHLMMSVALAAQGDRPQADGRERLQEHPGPERDTGGRFHGHHGHHVGGAGL